MYRRFGLVRFAKDRRAIMTFYVVTVVCVAAAFVLLGFSVENIDLVVVAMVSSGVAVGILDAPGPVIAATAVPVINQGQAIAWQGISRTSAMFAAPISVSSLLLVMPVAGLMILVAIATAASAFCAAGVREPSSNE